ncbi:hypothetical protein DMENIID0001_143970 [Sergentomyia squamirostris]
MSQTEATLTVLDSILFIIVIAVSFLIGLYHGFLSKRKQNTPEEYFLGGKSMNIIPVAVSLVVTFVSGMTIIGVTADVYAHGTLHWLYIVTNLIMVLITGLIFLPVFYDLQLPSSFSYLQLRFGRKVQLLGSFIYIASTMLFVPINFYVPALVVNHITGASIGLTTIILGFVCIFYTALGGFRAVIWADLFQTSLIFACYIAIMYIGVDLVGGVPEIWDASKRGGRLIAFDLNPDPTLRLTTWTMLFGHTFLTTQNFGLNQTSIQRFLSVSSLTKARTVLVLFYVGYCLFHMISIGAALVIYAYFEDCDPLTSGQISKLDQLVPLFILKIADRLPGLVGIFVAGIFAASLSTMSSCLNSLTTCLFEDFIQSFLPTMSAARTCTFLKVLTIGLGCLQIGLVFAVEKMGTLYTIVITILGLTCGTMLGLFTMGMLVKRANQTGAIFGTISSLVGVGVIIIGGWFKSPDPSLQMRTDGCLMNSTIPTIPPLGLSDSTDNLVDDDLVWIFKISFMFYSTVGFFLVYLIGYPISIITGGNVIKDNRLLAPFMRNKLPKKDPAAEQGFLSVKTEVKI